MSDLSETLTLALRSGDREAWNLVVRSETARLHGIAWAISRDSGLAEDAVQETFLRLVEGRVRQVRRGAARALLASMTARAAIDALRRREARRKREEAHGMACSQEDTAPGPEKAILDAELARSIDDALALLDPITRAAVWLHVVEGHGVRDVARTIEMARSTTADRIRAGLGRLEETLRHRGLASVLTLGWAALLGKSAIKAPSPELVDRFRALGDRLEPGSSAVHRERTGSPALLRAAGLAGVILAGGGLTLLLLRLPETAPAGVATSPVGTTPRPTAIATAPQKLDPESPGRAAPSEQATSNSLETFRIGGTVYDTETRLPIAGARIRPDKTLPAQPGFRREATSGPDGEFELVIPVDADEAFIAEAEGYSPTGDIWVGRGESSSTSTSRSSLVSRSAAASSEKMESLCPAPPLRFVV